MVQLMISSYLTEVTCQCAENFFVSNSIWMLIELYLKQKITCDWSSKDIDAYIFQVTLLKSVPLRLYANYLAFNRISFPSSYDSMKVTTCIQIASSVFERISLPKIC